MKFGDFLRAARENKGWKQPDAAARVEIEQSYLSKLETGKSYPSEEVFSKLLAAYGVSPSDVSDVVSSSELNKLKEIAQVREVILSKQKTTQTIFRGWLIAGLFSLMLGGACLGFVAMMTINDPLEFRYQSWGVLQTGESLQAYDIISDEINVRHPNFEELRAKQQAMIERTDQKFEVKTKFRGDAFIENAADGRRYYQLFSTQRTSENSPFRWFFIPALMFLMSSFGCFFIAFRWK